MSVFERDRYSDEINKGKAGLLATKAILDNINHTADPVVRYTLMLKLLRMGAEYSYHFGFNALTEEKDKLEENIEDGDLELASAPEDKRPKWTRIQRQRQRALVQYDEVLKLIKDVHSETMKYMEAFEDWVAQPYYGPDHPGNFVRQTQESFDGEVNKQEAKKEQAKKEKA